MTQNFQKAYLAHKTDPMKVLGREYTGDPLPHVSPGVAIRGHTSTNLPLKSQVHREVRVFYVSGKIPEGLTLANSLWILFMSPEVNRKFFAFFIQQNVCMS